MHKNLPTPALPRPNGTVALPPRHATPLRERRAVVLVPLAIAFLYSLSILLTQWQAPEKTKTPTAGAALTALLFRQDTRWHLYDLTGTIGYIRGVNLPETASPALGVRLISNSALLLSTESGARVRDTASSYTYDPLAPSVETDVPLPNERSALSLVSRQTNFVFSIPFDRPARLRITLEGCASLAEISLPGQAGRVAPLQLLTTLGLPVEQRMFLSPAELSMAILDHRSSSRITLVDLLQQRSLELSAPSFAEDQVHFSPLFLDEDTLLFSVLDSTHWGTVLYHGQEDRYEQISESFTDRAYLSTSGKLVLVQSAYDGGTLNIPFGSRVLLSRKRVIPARLIETIIGPGEEAQAIRALFFENPSASALHFRSDLNNTSFNQIEDPQTRESLRTLWHERRAELAATSGTFHILTGKAGALTHAATVPFSLGVDRTFITFDEQVEPLLNALELPKKLIDEYRKRNSDLKKSFGTYRLIDAWYF